MAKFKISGVEGHTSTVVLEVQYNPKEIYLDKAIPWQHQASKGPSDLAYAGGGSRTMSCELVLDNSASSTSIQADIDKLQSLSEVDISLQRPPKVKIAWGEPGTDGLMPEFTAVIEQLSVRYTMFDISGKPVRGTVNLKFREARNVMAQVT